MAVNNDPKKKESKYKRAKYQLRDGTWTNDYKKKRADEQSRPPAGDYDPVTKQKSPGYRPIK